MNRLIVCAVATLIQTSGLVNAADKAGAPWSAVEASSSRQISGLDLQFVDDKVRPQDDLYRYLNGKWLDSFEIPADQARYGSFQKLAEDTDLQSKAILEKLAHAGKLEGEAKKLADLYHSFIDEATLESLGYKPLKPLFQEIDAINRKEQFPALIARFNTMSITAPYDLGIAQDARDSTKYAVYLGQSGLGMPDRDYYLKDEAKLKQAREDYLAHVEKMLALAGIDHAKANAAGILKLETSLAEAQWTKVQNRDPVKTYNKIAIAALDGLTPGFPWQPYLSGVGIDGKVNDIIVAQPSYIKAFNELLKDTPLAVWRAYFKWHALSASAPFLSKAFVDEHFAFYGTALRGVPQNRDRWKRGVALVNMSLGEAFGKLYVAEYFPAENKTRMQALVRNLIEAYRRDIGTLDWMSAKTKQTAHKKLDTLVTKIGYPDRWRDYSALTIVPSDLLGNVQRAATFEYQRNLAKLGKPIDRSEWLTTPQTVDAFYNPLLNEIVFPAGILQPPFFNAKADDAVNYGAIGGVIGHELSHGFDDQGSQYDADGNLRDWFTKEDHDKFAAKTKALVEQYNAISPIPGYKVNGELTLGENIADNSGLAIAYQAYKISLNGAPSPVIDNLTGEQRFYLSWAQVWRGKTRENEATMLIKIDPHSPFQVRGLAPLRNQQGFYDAFGVQETDKMYLPPDKRVTIW